MTFQYLRLKTHETLFLIILSLVLILTRGSHITTFYSLPDASLALFLVGGIYLKNIRFFLALFLLGLVIDFGASAFDPKLGFCLTNGYWGLIPAYGVLWLSGYFLHNKKSIQKLSIFIPIVSIAIILAFIISTQTYYMFSGRFGNPSFFESVLHGWEYLPQYFLSSFAYIGIFWLISYLVNKNKFLGFYKKFKSS
ncbi:MAG: hypothetical protein NTY58_05400 [Candidatus Methylopumilus sp.]|nr:hypothetical protein [Candidatus Methylopumilus sp.]